MSLSMDIVIPTYERHVPLGRTLASLATIDLTGVRRILIVDQSARPLDVAAARLAFRPAIDLALVRPEERGLPHARNAGLRASTADVVLFLDDDVTPASDLASAHLRTYDARSECVGVAGRELLPPGRGPGARSLALRALLRRIEGARARATGRRREYLAADGAPVAVITGTGLVISRFDAELEARVMTPRGCNMSFRRNALLAIGGFDEDFPGIARREETDTALRLLARDPHAEIWFQPAAVVTHHMESSGGCRSDDEGSRATALFRCEARFAARHLGPVGGVIHRLRVAMREIETIARHPASVRALRRPRDVARSPRSQPRST